MKREDKEKVIKRLEEIRIELTGIYFIELGNPEWVEADSKLASDIHKIEKNILLDKPEINEETKDDLLEKAE